MTPPPQATAGRRGWIAVFFAALVLYVLSACPVVFWGDSAELSRRALTLELAPVARAYPLHRVLSWGAGRLAGDPAYGSNLVSAVFGAVSIALVFEIARRLGRSTLAGVTAALVTGLAHTFWSYSGVAEVYTLHTALMLGAILLAIRCDAGGRDTRVALGVLLGISLLHHRMIAFVVPGIAVWLWTGTPPRERLRAVGHVVLGAVLGAVPFVVLCVVASRSPPPEVTNRVLWWFQDVFMGGERNAGFILGEGRKGLGQSASYLGRWIVFNLPGPALVLAAAGIFAGGRRVAALLLVLGVAHLWFPLNYDWTGDQYTFLIPLYPIVGMAAGVAVAWIERRRGRGTASAVAGVAALAPLVLYAGLAFTSLGQRALPGLTPDAARATILPVHDEDRVSRDWCASRLERLPPNARLHCDWGDGEVYLYLQEAENLRRDVRVDVWVSSIRLGDGSDEEWLSVLPFTNSAPRLVEKVRERLEDRGDGLFRVRAR